MPIPYVARRPLSRRAFLRGAGVALSLPVLDAMAPAFARAAAKKAAAEAPRRMVAVETNMGILPHLFFPGEPGRDYKPSPYLDILKGSRGDLTVFSGVSHPSVDGGHQAEASFLTAAPHPGTSAFRNSISLDQLAAERLGVLTRFPSFTLVVSSEGRSSLSFTRSGVMVPGEPSPSALYRQMFVQGDAKDVKARVEDLRVGRSVLDFVNGSAKRLKRDLGPRDVSRLDQYFTSVRDLETQLTRSEAWEHRPKPRARAAAPVDITDTRLVIDRSRLMFDTIRLAFETDSTRLVTLSINTASTVPAIPGVSHETHSLTHHGNRPDALDELRKVEEAQFRVLAGFLDGLRGAKEGGETLLDRTMVLYGTCMGSANSHSNTNLPVLLAGGGFKHGRHLAFDTQKNAPLPNLYVSMLQRLGLETDRFASSTGTMTGLEMS